MMLRVVESHDLLRDVRSEALYAMSDTMRNMVHLPHSYRAA